MDSDSDGDPSKPPANLTTKVSCNFKRRGLFHDYKVLINNCGWDSKLPDKDRHAMLCYKSQVCFQVVLEMTGHVLW